jgi:hypothetical protein
LRAIRRGAPFDDGERLRLDARRRGADGYPVFPGDPHRDIRRALNECLEAIDRDYMAYLRRSWSPDPAVSEPAKAESYRQRARAEEAVLRAFIAERPGEWAALFHVVLDRALWLNSGDFAWESTCEALEAIREQIARDYPQLAAAAYQISVELPEGESLEWQTSLTCGGRTLYRYTSGEPYYGGSHMRRGDLRKILVSLLRRKVAWSADDIRRMLETIASEPGPRWMLPAPSVLQVAERYVSGHGMSPEIRDALGRIKAKHDHRVFPRVSDRKIVERVDRILAAW